MENSYSPYLILLFTLLTLATSSTPTIHDFLRSHGLPGGILPKGVKSFTFDPSSGLLEATLYRPCYAKYDSLAYFDRVVRGNLSFGELKGVEGFEQEELFLWLPVKGIQVLDPASRVVLLDIGVAHKRLSMSLFDDAPDCRPVRKAPQRRSALKWMHGIKEREDQQEQR